MRKSYHHILVASLCLLSAMKSSAQDALPGQFWNLPATLNPAQAGLMDASYRAGSTYRRQWASLVNPFTNVQAAFDARLGKANKSSQLGLGAYVRQHQAGKGMLRTFEAGGQAAVHLKVGEKRSLSFGLTAGYRQRSLRMEELSWDSQYNGISYDPGLDSGEAFDRFGQGNVDLAFGWNYRQRGTRSFDVGYSASHHLQGQGLLENSQDRLQIRHLLMFQWEADYGPIHVVYDALAAVHGGAQTILAGGRAYYSMGNSSQYTNAYASNAVFGGLHYRWADAVLLSAGYHYQQSTMISISYEVTSSALQRQSAMQGAWELALVWTGWAPGSKVKVR